MREKYLILFMLCLCGLTFLYLCVVQLAFSSDCDNALSGPIFHKLLKNSYHGKTNLREKLCDDSTCYYIYDYMVYVDYIPRILRVFGMDIQSGLGFSMSVLKTPSCSNVASLDTSKWQIDKEFINYAKYPVTITEALFWSGSVPTSSTDAYSVLMIGLGGSSFNNYYQEKYPHLNVTVVELSPLVVKLARSWFGLEETDMHRVIEGDGVEYIEEEALGGNRFNAVLLDATHSDLNRIFVSPIEPFFHSEFIQNVASIIDDKGVLVMNIVLGKLCTHKVAAIQQLVGRYREFFKYIQITQVSDFNAVLVARQVPIDTPANYELPKIREIQFY